MPCKIQVLVLISSARRGRSQGGWDIAEKRRRKGKRKDERMPYSEMDFMHRLDA